MNPSSSLDPLDRSITHDGRHGPASPVVVVVGNTVYVGKSIDP